MTFHSKVQKPNESLFPRGILAQITIDPFPLPTHSCVTSFCIAIVLVTSPSPSTNVLHSYMFHTCCPTIHDILRHLYSITHSLYELLECPDSVTCIETSVVLHRKRLWRSAVASNYSGRYLGLAGKRLHGIMHRKSDGGN